MVDQGLIEEAKKLYDYRNLNALDTVGYKELFNYIEGSISKKDAINLIKRNSRRYAKRQITWFKKFKDIHWIEKTDDAKMLEIILQSLQSL
jgi:tRNA dimethylallyltransferase